MEDRRLERTFREERIVAISHHQAFRRQRPIAEKLPMRVDHECAPANHGQCNFLNTRV